MQKNTLLLSFCFIVLSFRLVAQLPSVQEVHAVFQAKCVSCHDHASPEAGLDLEGTGSSAYLRAVNVAQNLINVAPANAFALGQGYKRVYPGRPDRSFLFRKINNGLEPTIAALHQDEGVSMPNYPGTPLTDVEKEIVRQWILYGAKTSGTQFNKSVVENFYNLGGEKAFPDGPPPAPAPGEGFQIKMGPFYLAPSTEVEYYQKYELALPTDVEVNRLALQMSGYSHHFIVYNFTNNGDAVIPPGLRLAANHSDINLVAAVQEQTDLKLPETTAFKWDNNIVLDLNSHYINYSAAFPYQCEAYLNVYTQASGTAEQEMFATLLVNPYIPIPNNGNLTTHTKSEFQFGADSIYVWGLMGHTHKYGRSYKAWKRLPNGQKGELIYDASCPFGTPGCLTQYFDYRHIPLRYWEPLLPIKWGNGIIHEATWVNEGPTAVNFGPTSDDEMMVLIAFYTLNPVTVGTGEPGNNLAERQVFVRPNPAHGNVTVIVPDATELRQFRLFDLTGRLVLSRNNIPGNSFDLDLSGIAPGIYLFNADGWTGKLVVE
ncbi:MAG TPA: T9SS type A sorting domain-containing protein [Saprospiraceae bacterium]|nr:T9SS type A sorting domain-containing protein [Saprospiraceae bacterium]